MDFILDRAKFVFREREGFGYDEVSAVFRAGVDDLVDAQKRLVALKAIRKSKNFEPLAVSFKRIRKILEKANVASDESHQVNSELFENAAERELYSAVREAATKVQTQKRAGKYQEALENIAGLRKAVDQILRRRHGDGGERSRAQEPPRIAGRIAARVHDGGGFF